MHIFLLILTVIPVCTIVAAPGAGTGYRSNYDHVSVADVDSIFMEFNSRVTPGCAAGVVSNGELILSRGYGIANLDYGIPIQPDSRFMIASLSKQFAVAALFMLEQEGKLDLDEDIRRYIPEMADFTWPITARQIIHHKSGLRDIYNLLIMADIGLDNTTTRDQAIDLLNRQQRLNFEPGSAYLYSNSGYFLISVLVEKLSGLSLREYTKKHFFEPLDMNDTHWHDDTGEIVPDRVISYRPMSFGPGQFYRGNMDRIGARGLFTTIGDFAKWDANFIENRTHLKDFSNKMMRPGYTNQRSFINYAAGLRLGRYKNVSTASHAGSYMGFRTSFMRFPSYNFTAIVFCNMSNIDPAIYTRKIADLYLKKEFNKQFREYPAVYKSISLNTAFELTLSNGDLYLRRINENELAEEPDECRLLNWQRNDQFHSGHWILDFKRDSNGRIDRFVLETHRTGKMTFYRE